jgi:pyridoxamine 5'-phosphate oxidase
MCLSTVNAQNRPASRYVLLKTFNEADGSFVWFTNYESKKGKDLAQNPNAALVFWWGDMERSVRIEGVVEKVSAEESDTYFAVRPRGAELGAWASHQSQPISSQEALHKGYDDIKEKFKGEETIPRPEFWGGYRLRPDMIEFWKGRSSRLHDRLEFKLNESGAWTSRRLQP